jgi:hypothetical protein
MGRTANRGRAFATPVMTRGACCVSRGKAGENASADPAANQNFRRIEELLYAKRNAMHFGISIGKLG